MPIELPDRIAYLAPVMNELTKFDPATLGDGNLDACVLVLSSVRSRLQGLDESQATETLAVDHATLCDWLSQPGNEMSTGHFIDGALLGIKSWADFDELIQ